MRVRISRDFPVGIDTLWTILAQPEFSRRKYVEAGSKDYRLLSFDANAESIVFSLERTVPAERAGVPDWAARLVPSDHVMRHETAWRRHRDRTADAVLAVVPVGIPVDIRGKGGLVELAPAMTRMSLQFDIVCKVPLLGRKIAELFAARVHEGMEHDLDFTRRAITDAV